MTTHENWTERLAYFFINRYRISILILLAIVAAGIWGMTTNQRQDFPKIPVNIVVVTTIYPGASPADVEQTVLIPIEQAAKNIDGVSKVHSTAGSSYGSVVVTLENTGNIPEISSKLADEIGKLGLPSNVDTKVDTVDAAGVSQALGIVSTNGMPLDDLLQYASTIKTRLEASSTELKKIEIVPDNTFSIDIQLDAAKFATSGVTFDAVKSIVQSYIISLPGGSINMEDGSKQSITISAATQSIEGLQKLPLGRVTLGDIATISRVPAEDNNAHFIGYKNNEGLF
ncbi:MAG: hypothetical protein COT25_03300, partial [Candidatus Kerfeldbacteria bacterium CG08_land_8_20_14_0_20_42_7]